MAPADARKLISSQDNWGTYYDTAPQVIALSLKEVTHQVVNSVLLRQYYQQAIGLITGSNFEQQLNDALACYPKGASHVA